MDDGLQSHLSTIKTEVAKLNASADRLAKAVRTLNERLAALNVGVVVYYTNESFEASADYGNGELVSCKYFAGYDRDSKGNWGINVMCHLRNPQDILKDGNALRWTKPFESCPRNVRLGVTSYIPKVVEGLANAVKKLSEDLDASIESIETLDIAT